MGLVRPPGPSIHVSFFELMRQVLRACREGLAPQQLRDNIKMDHPDYYGTESCRRSVEQGHYKGLDHALLVQIQGRQTRWARPS